METAPKPDETTREEKIAYLRDKIIDINRTLEGFRSTPPTLSEEEKNLEITPDKIIDMWKLRLQEAEYQLSLLEGADKKTT